VLISPAIKNAPFAVETTTYAPFVAEQMEVRILAGSPGTRRDATQLVQLYDFSEKCWVVVDKISLTSKPQLYTTMVDARRFISVDGEVRTRFVWGQGQTSTIWIDCICHEFRFTK
jgi:hypothetical protein